MNNQVMKENDKASFNKNYDLNSPDLYHYFNSL